MLSATTQQTYTYPAYSADGIGYSVKQSGAFAAGADQTAVADAEQVVSRRTNAVPGQNEKKSDGTPKDDFELSQEAQEIRELQLRDQEVKAHEAAHAAAGGAYAGAPKYTYERGPDGKSYATDGEVRIDTSPIAGDPQATLQKAQQIRTAALAPAEPSAQDMKVAQKAQSMAAKARMEISSEPAEAVEEHAATDNDSEMIQNDVPSAQDHVENRTVASSGVAARLDIYG